eukprot:CAMPEP_0198254608 /NCGR_PEP_ID=MMETSP1447-20131203/4885_1 /TAXON_ID=420782 /ORGANISM="Chaetoceros dichaeta, Strain CCMP1751" /LENGTH=44 /DNA_ID= /DNA_START= /DNA_END= /DNA_ORIENTATION=
MKAHALGSGTLPDGDLPCDARMDGMDRGLDYAVWSKIHTEDSYV